MAAVNVSAVRSAVIQALILSTYFAKAGNQRAGAAFGSMAGKNQVHEVSGDMAKKIERTAGQKGASQTPTAALAREIDENLKRVYSEALEPELPDRFRALLEALRARKPDGDGGPGR